MTSATLQDQAEPPEERSTSLQRRSLRASIIGNALEWYDWTVYAVFSAYIAAAVFSQNDPVSALLSTLAIFAVGFLMRPLGGMIFGAMADRVGRRNVLVLTMSITAAGSLLIGLSPTYDQTGYWASLTLLLARLAQGLSHGGESATSYAYVAEIAPPARRGWWSSSIFMSVTIGTLIATGFGAALTSLLTDEAMRAWGWRVPFIAGAALGIFAIYLRRQAMETEAFTAVAEPEAHASVQPVQDRQQLWKSGARLVVFTAGTTVVYYSWVTFAAAHAINVRGMEPNTAFIASFLAQLVALVAIPFWGRLSDRIGRKPLCFGFAIAFMVVAFPLDMMISTAGWTLFVAQAIALTVWAMVAGLYPALMAEQVPTRSRVKAIGVAGSLSVALFGGSAPYLSSWLATRDLHWVFTVYLMFLCLATLIATITMRETRGIDLRDA